MKKPKNKHWHWKMENGSRKLLINSSIYFLFSIFHFLPLSHAAFSNLQTPEDRILSKGFAAYMDGADNQALSYFEEVIRINPKNSAAQKGLDKVKIRLRKAKDIEKVKAHDLARAKYKEGVQLNRTGDTVAAIDSFHAAVDAEPEFHAATSELADIKKDMTKLAERKKLNLTTWSFARGTLAYLDRDWAKAYRIWSERLRMEPTNIPLANATARAENNFKRMMLAEQEDFFRRGARAFYEQGLYQQSNGSWRKVLALRTDDQEAMEGVARTEEAVLRLQGKGKIDEVHDLLEQALSSYANQDWRKALASFEQLAAASPEMTTAQDYITQINEKLKSADYVPAFGGSGNSIWKPSRPSNDGVVVKVSDKFENIPETIRDLETRIKRDPSDMNAQIKLDAAKRSQNDESERLYKDGLIAYSQGNRTVAISQWQKVLVIDPDHKKAAQAIKKAKAEEERSAGGDAQ